MSEKGNMIRSIAQDDDLMHIAREVVQEEIIRRRDRCEPPLIRGNGLVVREYDGTPSSDIRMGLEEAMRLGLKAIAAHMDS